MGATAAKLLIRYRKPIAKAILGFFVFIIVIFLLIFNNDQTAPSGGLATENKNLSESVLRYKSTVEKYARQYDGMEYVPYILALMQIESGGNGGDPMQSSESLGLPPNTIKDPERSIQRGVEFFVENMKSAINRGSDIKTALQAYNYGGGFVDFVVKNGGTYSFELAKQFSINMSGGEKVPYVNALSTTITAITTEICSMCQNYLNTLTKARQAQRAFKTILIILALFKLMYLVSTKINYVIQDMMDTTIIPVEVILLGNVLGTLLIVWLK